MLEIVNYVQRRATPEWEIPRSTIGFHDLTFIYNGQAVYVINDKPHRVSAGTLIYIKPGSVRRAYTSASNPMHSFAINLAPEESKLLNFQPLTHVGLDEQLMELYKSFDRAWLVNSELRGIKTDAYLNLILCRLNELETFDSKTDMRVERAKEYILANYYKDIGVKQLAKNAGLNEVYFGALFKRTVGQSINRYINTIRVNRAKDLLADGNSVAETSSMCGFENVFYFSNVFKKIAGNTPTFYKR